VLLGLVAVIAVGFFAISLQHYLTADVSVAQQPLPETVEPPAEQIPEPDFNPPDIPIPDTYEEARQWLDDNAVYAESVTVPTDCALTEVDATTAGVRELEDHLNNLTGCLWMVWHKPLEAAGFVMPRPPVTVYDQPITTACGDQDSINAVYCAGDQRVYYAQALHRVFPPEIGRIPFMPDMVIGHEFGHAIQARTGILISELAFEQQATEDKDTEQAEVLSRRAEQQADCLAGQFLQSVAQASGMTSDNLAGLQTVSANLGDDVLTGKPGYVGDHGSSEARQRWFTTGLTQTSIAQCNTWTVPDDQVH
jgi:predicted metalloprotease